MDEPKPEPKPLIWIAGARDDLSAFPDQVRATMGYALFLAQAGERHPTMTKTLKGFGGGSVVEVKENYDGNAYRAVYTVRFAHAVFVLHAFQKKSRKGVATSQADIDTVRRRLRELTQEMEALQ